VIKGLQKYSFNHYFQIFSEKKITSFSNIFMYRMLKVDFFY